MDPALASVEILRQGTAVVVIFTGSVWALTEIIEIIPHTKAVSLKNSLFM
jgi:hypothetical protein